MRLSLAALAFASLLTPSGAKSTAAVPRAKGTKTAGRPALKAAALQDPVSSAASPDKASNKGSDKNPEQDSEGGAGFYFPREALVGWALRDVSAGAAAAGDAGTGSTGT